MTKAISTSVVSAAKSRTQALSSAAARPLAAESSQDDHRSSFMEPEQRQARIAQAAYYRAEARSFQPGHDVEDWLAAEVEIDAELVSLATRG